MGTRCCSIVWAVVLVFLAGAGASVRAGELNKLDTRHYEVHTDLDHALAEELGKKLDAMYDEYARRLSGFNADKSDQRLIVYLFKKVEDYNAFTQNRAPNTGGVFLPQRQMLAAYYEGQGRDALRRALQHEAFHQFAHSMINRNLPPWLNEGLAVLFEEGIWVGDDFHLGEVPPRRLRQLRADQAGHRLTEFRDFMSMNNDRWTQQLKREPGLAAAQYNQAWAMVHFLVFVQENGQFKYRKRFIEMLRMIQQGTQPQQAFEQALSKNVENFQARFAEFVATLTPTDRATLIERQDVLGDMLIELKRMGKKYDSVADFREEMVSNGYRLQYSKFEVKWTSEEDPRVYFRAPGGHELSADELFFDSRQNAPLPDLVYRGPGDLKLRTKFYDMGNTVLHEMIVEPK
ncbi:MAG TPA: DUF1570 domain-containing protein [Tepidisphaeraceae bacterium]|jgi:hypothetical protein